MQGENLDPRFIPDLEMSFETLEDAYEFYRHYAELAGFPAKKNRKRDKKDSEGQEFCCSIEGKHKVKVSDVDRQRGKTSKRGGCRAMVLAQTAGIGGPAFFTRIVLEHNHKLVPSPSMTKRMRSHKKQDPAVVNLVDTMHAGGVAHVNVMRVLRKFAGGSENLHFTERDIQNRCVLSNHVTEYCCYIFILLLHIFLGVISTGADAPLLAGELRTSERSGWMISQSCRHSLGSAS